MARPTTTTSDRTWRAAAAKARRRLAAPIAALAACLVLAAPAVAQSSGKVVAWGYNLNGEATVPAAAAANVKAVAAGGSHSLALK
jgi:hypothetical protein